ncbi:hypothetical protein JMJ77_0002539 [Colletotrichum scovillei]|uniref:Uncharacterized protein n=1 Tax=Colletotrichum scovillei TaxID=1209932 RepID=A0A9P7R835_9PEZI|nr:hypothetical protein JMJ77_0002539 [Colletotrichum scovillei]KAG7070961.1 hypothetical protein JMJ76_0002202 [Colletotrichum scovillei]KAG7079240.1 hypothetical protein JMJ78_0002896 [Colletotrichum scovillei]
MMMTMVISRFNDRRKKNFTSSNSNSRGPTLNLRPHSKATKTMMMTRRRNDANTVVTAHKPEGPKDQDDQRIQATETKPRCASSQTRVRKARNGSPSAAHMG